MAAAAAEILFAAVAGFAGLLHPIFSAEFLECDGALPNFPQPALFHVFEREVGDHLRRVAGKRIAGWSDEHQLATPAAHAGLGIFCVVIGDHVFDTNPAFQPLLFAFNDRHGAIQLLACGKKIFPVRKGPAVILDVGEFDACGAGRFGESHHLLKLIDVAAMNDKIKRQRNAMLLDPFEDAEFLPMGLRAGDFIGDFFPRALEAELDVVKSGSDEGREFRFIEGQAGSDQIDVEAGGASCAHKIDNVSAGERFTAGEICLENAELGGFLKDARPGLGGELVGSVLHLQGIRAVDAMERAAVGEFGD